MIRLHYFLILPIVSSFIVSQRKNYNSHGNSCAHQMAKSSSIVVVSPPGGIGEVAAVKAACLGSSVRWFVVSDESSSSVQLSAQVLGEIASASGELDLAGASVASIKSDTAALSAVAKWCGNAEGLICTYDGTNDIAEFKAAIRLAVQEASPQVVGPKVVVLGPNDDVDADMEDQKRGLTKVLGSLFQDASKIASSLIEATSENPCVVRHGTLFGSPESSPDFSPLVGGPRRDPIVTEEYTMRDVRLEPYGAYGNTKSSNSLKACRHAVGKACALIATSAVPVPSEAFSIVSQLGSEEITLERWNEEFGRLNEASFPSNGAKVFDQKMIVDDTERLADWLATKWAPAVLRTYDIAAIRIGARPVYALRSGAGAVEIVWQELVNFQSVVTGRMVLEVTADGITARRASAENGGATLLKPLPGEEVLVGRLAEAASQAIDKGLAKKIISKRSNNSPKPTPTPVSSLESSGSVIQEPDMVPASEAGPRKAGARRSTPRQRRGSDSPKTSDS